VTQNLYGIEPGFKRTALFAEYGAKLACNGEWLTSLSFAVQPVEAS
jgi:hypothetical protein